MAAKEQGGGGVPATATVVRWEDAPGRGTTVGGVGCAALLALFAAAGAVAALDEQAWGTLLGLPFALFVAALIAAVSLARTVTRVEQGEQGPVLRSERRVLGLRVGRREVDLGGAEALAIVPLEVAGRTLHRIQVRRAGRSAVDLVAEADGARARERAARIAAVLGVEVLGVEVRE